MGIYRGEVATIMGALADLRLAPITSERSRRTRMKRKRRKGTMSPEEVEAWRKRGEEQVRKLRELVAKGEAELEAKRAAEGSGQ